VCVCDSFTQADLLLASPVMNDDHTRKRTHINALTNTNTSLLMIKHQVFELRESDSSSKASNKLMSRPDLPIFAIVSTKLMDKMS